MNVSELLHKGEGYIGEVSGYLYHGLSKQNKPFWKLSASDGRDADGTFIKFWQNCEPSFIPQKSGKYVKFSGKGLKWTCYNDKFSLNVNPGHLIEESGQGSPSPAQSPSAASQPPSQSFGDDRDKKMRDGMTCNMMSRLVASGKSVDEAHEIALAIISKVEGVVAADEDGDAPF